MHHFISESTWDASGVMDKVAKDVSKALPKQKLTGLLIDESGWEKKGDKSVGVGHQYCGNVGKTANSQVAVFGCLCNDKYASLIDARLYLPRLGRMIKSVAIKPRFHWTRESSRPSLSWLWRLSNTKCPME